MNKQKFKKLILTIILTLGFFAVSGTALAEEKESTGIAAGPYVLPSTLYAGALMEGSSSPQVTDITANYRFNTSYETSNLVKGETIDITQTDNILDMKVSGGKLGAVPGQVSGNWGYSGSGPCSGGKTYLVGTDTYAFSLCAQTAGFALSSSNPSIIDCSGTTCTAKAVGSATITATPSATNIYTFIAQNGVQVPIPGISQPLGVTTNPVSWTMAVFDPPTVDISSSADGSVLTAGDSVTLSWSSTNVSAISKCEASDGWSGTKEVNGTLTIANLNVTKRYVLTCYGMDGRTTVSDEVKVQVGASQLPTFVKFSSVASSLGPGEETMVSWEVTNAVSCDISSSPDNGWSEPSVAVKSSKSSGTITADTYFSLHCTSSDGAESTRVLPILYDNGSIGAVELDFETTDGFNNVTINYGSSVSLQWTASNAISCTSSGEWGVSSRNLVGSYNTGSLTEGTYTYTLICTNSGGDEVSKNVVVNVKPFDGPILNFYMASLSTYNSPQFSSGQVIPDGTTIVNNSTITNYGYTYVSQFWNVSNAAYCVYSGTYGGGNFSPRTFYGPTINGWDYWSVYGGKTGTWTMECTGYSGQKVSKTQTVYVDAPEVSLQFSAYPLLVDSGGSATLTWSSTNATQCVVDSGSAFGGWWDGVTPQVRATSGTFPISNITANQDYRLYCVNTNTGKVSPTQVVSIAINTSGGPVPELAGDFWMTEYYNSYGNVTDTGIPYTYDVIFQSTVGMHWNFPDAESCIAKSSPTDSQWNGVVPTSYGLSPATYSGWLLTIDNSAAWPIATFTIECSGSAGSVTRTITANTLKLDPNVTAVWSDPASPVTSGTPVTIWYTATWHPQAPPIYTWCYERHQTEVLPTWTSWVRVKANNQKSPDSFSGGTLLSDTTYQVQCEHWDCPDIDTCGSHREYTVAVDPPPGPPVIDFYVKDLVAPYKVEKNSYATLEWSATAAEKCWSEPGIGNTWATASRALTGSISVGPITLNSSFDLLCQNVTGTTRQTVFINLDSPLKVDVSAWPNFIPYNSSTEINWNITAPSYEIPFTDYYSCQGDPSSDDENWAGKPITSAQGRFQTERLLTNTSYKIICEHKTDPTRNTAGSASVEVAPIGTLGPSMSFSASSSRFNASNQVTLNWSQIGATSCSGSWTGSALSPSGSATVTNPSPANPATYDFMCFSDYGNRLIRVEVLPSSYSEPAVTMTLDFWADKTTNIAVGEEPVVRWNSTDAKSCTADMGSGSPAYAGWIGNKKMIGNEKLAPFSETGVYFLRITCTNPSSTNVTVDDDGITQLNGTIRKWIALTVGSSGVGAIINMLPVVAGDGKDIALPVNIGGGENNNAYMFNAKQLNDPAQHIYAAWTTFDANGGCEMDNLDDMDPAIVAPTETNSGGGYWDLGEAGYTKHKFKLICYYDVAKTISSTAFITLAPYKFEICSKDPVIYETQETEVHAYYIEYNTSNSVTDLSGYQCSGENYNTPLATDLSKDGSTTWGSSSSINMDTSGDPVKAKGVSADDGAQVNATANVGFDISANKGLPVLEASTCYNCSDSGNCSSSFVYGSCVAPAYDDLQTCIDNCSGNVDLNKWREVAP